MSMTKETFHHRPVLIGARHAVETKPCTTRRHDGSTVDTCSLHAVPGTAASASHNSIPSHTRVLLVRLQHNLAPRFVSHFHSLCIAMSYSLSSPYILTSTALPAAFPSAMAIEHTPPSKTFLAAFAVTAVCPHPASGIPGCTTPTHCTRPSAYPTSQGNHAGGTPSWPAVQAHQCSV